MRRLWSVLMASVIVTAIAAFATFGNAAGSQEPASTPSIDDLATRVAGLETRVAALEPSPSSTARGNGAATFTLEAHDPFNWSVKSFTIEAGGTITIENTGVLPHDFSVDALKITQPLDPGKTYEIKIPDDAKPGEYEFYCNVPGHKQAGMFGTMTVAAKDAGHGQAQQAETQVPSQTASTRTTEQAANIKVTMGDLFFKPKQFQIPADIEVTVTLKNTGVLPHDFNIDQLNVHSDLIQPGETSTVRIKAPNGTYQYYCNQPGHKAAGMVGTLTVSGEAESPLRNVQLGNAATAQATVPATTQTIDVPPFRVTVVNASRTDSVGTAVTSKARGVYVVAVASVVNTSNAPVSIIATDLFKATLRDSQGRTFSLDITGSVYASPDFVAEFQPGLTYEVELVFDVPPDASGFTLVVGDREVPLAVVPAP